MSGVQFGQQIDMNGFKVTEVAPGTTGTDAVNLNQLDANAPQGFAQTIGDGTNSTYTINHAFNTLDVLVEVFELSTNHTVWTDPRRSDVNNVVVEFGAPIASNSHRVLVVPVP